MGQILDFIEVGTADFNTIIESCHDDAKGISIEPLEFYLDNLPNKPFVKKLAAALVPQPISSIDTYYIEPELIDKPELKLYGFMKGCNSVGKPHDYHLKYTESSTGYEDEYTICRNLIEEGLVTIKRVPAITYYQLMEIYNIEFVNQIKLDTEGQDSALLNSILDYYQTSGKKLPNIIEFETNIHNNQEDLIQVGLRLISLNYKLQIGDSYYNTFKDFNGTFEKDCIATLIKN
jgi:hypothetical protein